MERRKNERRIFRTVSGFPLITSSGRIVDDRRRQPDRRLNNIEVTLLDFTAEVVPYP
jgi:hypothetical protein